MAGKQLDPTVVSLCLALARESRELADPRHILHRGRNGGSPWRTLHRLGRLWLEGGETESAGQALHSALEAYRQVYSEENGDLLVDLAFLAASQGLTEEAVRLLTRARATPQAQNASPAMLGRVARIYHRVEKPAMAREVCERAVALARQPGERESLRELLELRMEMLPPEAQGPWAGAFHEWLPLVRERRPAPGQLGPTRDLLRQASELGLEAARELLEQLQPDTVAATVASPGEHQPEVELTLLGVPRVVVRGQELPATEWGSRKPYELFLLLAFHGRPLSRERVSEALWPDQEASRHSVNSAVSRARRALRELRGGLIVFERSFFSFHPQIRLDCDLVRYDQSVEQCQLDASGRLSEAARRAGERALELYRGELLEGCWWEWAARPREAYREKHFGLVLRLAREQERQSSFAAAQRYYESLLSLDPCREEAVVGLMTCLAQQGLRESAVRRYNDYCRTLHRELSLTPGQEAVRHYHQLLASS